MIETVEQNATCPAVKSDMPPHVTKPKLLDQVRKRIRVNWTPEQEAMLRKRYPHEHTASLAESLGYSVRQVYTKAHAIGLRKTAEFLASALACRLRRGDNVGAAHRFKPGHKTWNSGLKGWTAGGRSAETRFKPGELSGRARALLKPIGAERINKDGYIERKINDDMPLQRRWRAVHLLVWEAANGPLPKGHAVTFRNGDKTDLRLENLECIPRRELMARNTVHNYGKEIAHLVQLRGAVTRQINKRERKTP